VNIRKHLLIVIVSFSIFSNLSLVYADRGIVPIPPIPMREDWQLAIIAWNDGEEVLILSTVLSPILKPLGKNLTDRIILPGIHGVEILPLKDIPYICESKYEYFYMLDRIIYKYGLKTQLYGPPSLFVKSAKGGVEIIYRKRIGPHKITVLKANRSEDLVDWLNKYIVRNRLHVSEKSFTKYIKVFKDYIDRGYKYFAIDVIILKIPRGTVYPEPFIVNPLLYRFSSECIYYPLKVSSLMEGDTYIKLYLLTRERVKPEKINSLGFEIYFERKIKISEISGIDKEIIGLFRNTEEIWLTVVTYKGKVSNLLRDLEVSTGFSIWQYVHYIAFTVPAVIALLVSLIVVHTSKVSK